MTGKYKEKMIRVKECCGCKSCLPFNGNLVCYKLDRTLNRPYTIPSDCPLEDVPEPTPVTAAKPPCKTCGGAGRVEDDDDDMSGPEPSYKSCPDCRAKTVNEDSVTVLKNGELSDELSKSGNSKTDDQVAMMEDFISKGGKVSYDTILIVPSLPEKDGSQTTQLQTNSPRKGTAK
jgi:hypothetical protein